MSAAATGAFCIEPSEPVLFGPPRSFSAGEAHRVRSQFPPPPMAFQGLIRSRLLLGAEPPLDLDGPDARSTIADLVGSPSELPPGWQIRGPFAACRGEPDPEGADLRPILRPWVPTPRFILRSGVDGGSPLHARQIISSHEALSDLSDSSAPVLGRPDQIDSEPLGGWIGPINLLFALAGEGGRQWDAREWGGALPPVVREEFQPGLAIDSAGSTGRHGLLYFAEALRFKPGSGLYGGLDTLSLSPPLTMRALTEGCQQAGRKGRLVLFRPVERLDPAWDAIMQGVHLPDDVTDGQAFWLVSLTPARIDDPSRPIVRASLPPGVRVDIVAAQTGRAFPLGGYEMATGRPRPNRLYVPGGSAWLVRVQGGTAEARRDALTALHDRHTLGAENEAAMGFGHTLVGLGPMTTEEQP